MPNLQMSSNLIKKIKLVCLISTFVSTIITVAGFMEIYTFKKIQTSGIEVVGSVVKQQVLHGVKGSKSTNLYVNYSSPDSNYGYKNVFRGVSSKTLNDITPQNTIKVKYLPTNPGKAIIGSSPQVDHSKLAVGLAVFLVSILILKRFNKKPVKADSITTVPQASSTEPLPLKLNLTPKLSFKCNDRDVVLSIYKRADEPEGSDILKFTTPENEFLVHSAIFLDYILSTKKNSFITEENEYKEILNGTFLDCNHMDDSREYVTLQSDNKSYNIPTHYLGLSHYICTYNNSLTLITNHFMDNNANQLPHVITKIDCSILEHNSAIYDENEEFWDYSPKD